MALILGALEQLAINLNVTPSALYSALNDDFADGKLDGKNGSSAVPLGSGSLASTAGTTDFLSALTAYENKASGTELAAKGVTATDLSQLNASLQAILGAATQVGGSSGGTSTGGGTSVGGGTTTGGGSTSTSGGGGSVLAAPAVQGTAAAGAPLVGNVEVKDFKGSTKTVAIGTNGAYAIDLTGLDVSQPLMLKAQGTVGPQFYTLYSAITPSDTQSGTINITPLTDIIVGSVAGAMAAQLYSTPAQFSLLTAANLAAATTALQTSLQNILTGAGLTTPVDLLRTSFSPNNTGLDLVLDLLTVAIDPNTKVASVTDKTTGNVINTTLGTTTYSGNLPAPSLTDVTTITQQFKTLQNLLVTQPPATDPQWGGVFDASFLHDGKDLKSFVADALLNSKLKNATLTVGEIVLSPVNAPSDATLVLQIHLTDGQVYDTNFKLKKLAGVWKIIGNQHIMLSGIDAKVEKTLVTDPGGVVIRTDIVSGLNFWDVEDDSPAHNIDYVIVKGKGLPETTGGCDGVSSGLLLVKGPTKNASFFVAQPPYRGSGLLYLLNPRTSDSSGAYNIFPISDVSVLNSFIHNEPYTFDFYSDNGTPLQNCGDDVLLQGGVTQTLPTRPLTPTEASQAQFAHVTASDVVPLATGYAKGGAGNTVTVAWTLPAGLQSSYAEAGRGSVTPFVNTGNRTQCVGTPIHPAWIVFDWFDSIGACPGTSPQQMLVLALFIDKPVGAKMDVCGDSPTPSGWVILKWFKNFITCGNGNTVVAFPRQNMKTIMNLNNNPQGVTRSENSNLPLGLAPGATSVILDPLSPLTNGEQVVQTFFDVETFDVPHRTFGVTVSSLQPIVALPRQEICSIPDGVNAVSRGWIVLSGRWQPVTADDTGCGVFNPNPPAPSATNVWIIDRYDDKPVGATMAVCPVGLGSAYFAPTPIGWTEVFDFVGPGCKTIQRQS